MTIALFARSNVHGDLYNQALSGVYRQGLRVHDPDFALFQDPEIYDKIRRDAVINHAIEQRRHAIAGRAWHIVPSGDTDEDKLGAKIMEDLLSQIVMMPSSLFNLAESVIRGSGYAFIQGTRKPMRVADMPTQSWWTPLRLQDVDRRRFKQTVSSDLDSNDNIKVIWEFWCLKEFRWKPLDNPQWFIKHIYEDTESRLGYGRGLLEAIYYYHYAKTVVLTEGLNACERWAQGLVHAAIDGAKDASTGKPNEEIVKAWQEQLEKVKSRHVLVHDKSDELLLQDGPGQGWQIVRELLAYLDNAVRVLITGAALTSSTSNGGSFALAKVQQDSQETLIQFDRTLLSETISRDLIGLVWERNRKRLFGLGLTDFNKPKFQISQDRQDDTETAVRVVTTALLGGINLRKDEVYEKIGFTPPRPGDEIIESQDPNLAAAFGQPGQLNPQGGGFPSLSTEL